MDIGRLFRHAFSTQRDARKLFSIDALRRLQAVIGDGESRHRGEVRLIIESAMPLRKIARGMTTRHRALDLFGTYRVWDTEDNNGVLLYLDVADRCVEIIADRAAARAVDEATWKAIALRTQQAFKDGAFERGTAEALVSLHDALAGAFPSDGRTRRNELNDRPVVR